jgi:Ca-activated chloride channel family protein
MDVSDSMSKGAIVTDLLGSVASKLSVAKTMAGDYIKQRENDHVGIIVFGDFAYVASPLSFDHESSAKLLKTVQKGVAGQKTAMYDALFLSARLLKDSPAKEKVAILLTDGFNTAGDIPLSVALRAIESEKLKVFTIGVGRYGEYDERALKEIAQRSGGEFYSAMDAGSLKRIYEHIDKLQKSKLNDKVKYNNNYLYMYPLIFAFFVFFIHLLLSLRGGKS